MHLNKCPNSMISHDLFYHQFCNADTISIRGAFMVPQIKKNNNSPNTCHFAYLFNCLSRKIKNSPPKTTRTTVNEAALLSSMNSHQKIPCLSALGVIWLSGAQWVRPTRPGCEELPQLPLPLCHACFQQRKVVLKRKIKCRMCISLICFSPYSTYWTYLFLPQCSNDYFNGNRENVRMRARTLSVAARTWQLTLHVICSWKSEGHYQTSEIQLSHLITKHKGKYFYTSIILIPPLIYRGFKMCFDKMNTVCLHYSNVLFLPDNCSMSFAPSKI